MAAEGQCPVSESRGASTSPFSVLAHSQYRLLFIGSTLAMLAFGMMNVVQGVVAFHLTGRNSAVGFVSLGQGLAMLFLSPVGGAMSDRISKRRLLLFAQGSVGIMFGVIAVLIFTGVLTIWILAFCTLLLGCMYAIIGPTRQAWIGDLLTGPELAHGVALQQVMMNATRIVGPLLAGALLAASFVGAGGVYIAMALSFALVVSVLALMQPTPPVARAVPMSMFGDLREGLGYIVSNRDVRLLALVFGGVVLSGFSYQTVMPGFLENALGHPASQLGLIYGTTAVGGIVTTLFVSTHQPKQPATLMMAFGAALSGSLLLLSIAPTFVVALAVASLVGASSSGFQMLNNVTLMQRTSPRFFGRVMAVTMMAFGLNAIVAYPIGAIADQAGERETMAGLACVSLLVVISGVFASTRIAFRGRTLGTSER
jgi:MFS family permease